MIAWRILKIWSLLATQIVPKSAYQSHMEAESTLSEETHNSSPRLLQGAGDIRYWSDFDRVYYLPRSVQKLPDPPEWKSTNLGWIQGHEMFTRHNKNLWMDLFVYLLKIVNRCRD